jgi:PAS domain S-box-containing protein
VREITFRSKLVIGVAAALLVLAAVGVLSYRRMREEGADASWVAHTHRVIETLDALLTDMIDAETGQRGYVLTGNLSYLQPYDLALQRLNADFHQVRQLTSDNPLEQRRLARMSALISSELAQLGSTIGIRRTEGLTAGAVAIQTGAGKRRMDKIRSLVAQMKQEEEKLLQQRLEVAASASRNAEIVILGGYLLGFLFLSGAGMLIHREMDKRAKTELELTHSEERFRLMVSNVHGYAIYLLDREGCILTWNAGAERMKGYTSEEVLGRHVSAFYTPEDRAQGVPEENIAAAIREGHITIEGWRIRKDGSRFWASAVLTALRDSSGGLRGFGKVTHDLSEQRRTEQEIKIRNAQLQAANQELEAFCYSVSHDLRAPLRSIDGFSQALLEDQADQIDDQGKAYLHRIRSATQRMGELIDDLLSLSRVTRAEISRRPTDLSEMATSIAEDMRNRQPDREVEFVVAPDMEANADPRLMRIVLQNLLDNAWKFTSKRERARIEFGRIEQNGSSAFFVRDNGAGFDPSYSGRLFGTFQRLHAMSEFPGTGIGLATVQRIVHRHGGKVWGEGAVDRGATFYFHV